MSSDWNVTGVTETKRWAAYADEALMDDTRQHYMVAMVTEGEPGYSPSTYLFGTPAEAAACADRINEARGLDRGDVLSIVSSSMRAHSARVDDATEYLRGSGLLPKGE